MKCCDRGHQEAMSRLTVPVMKGLHESNLVTLAPRCLDSLGSISRVVRVRRNEGAADD